MRVHYKSLCNFQGRYDRKTSDDLNEITCKVCLRKIKQYNLQPRSNFPEVPTFEVKAEDCFVQNGTSKLGCHLVFRCPVCGRKIMHGGTYNEKGAGDGHRCSHCQCWNHGGYYIKEV